MLEPPLKVTFTKGEWCSGDSNDRRMPLLSEVFEAFPNIPINIDSPQSCGIRIITVYCCDHHYVYKIYFVNNNVIILSLYLY